QRLDCVLHADAINDCWLSKSWAGFMLFNPPYGDVRGEYREGSKTAKRLEAEFWAHHAARVQRGGIMAALLPQSAFTKAPGLVKAMSHYFAGERVGVYQAAVDTYRQILVIGYRRRDRSAPQNKALLTRLTQIGIGVEIPEPLPAATSDPFRCPAGLRPDSFEAQSITRESVEMALTQESGDTLQAVEAELSAQHAVRTHPPSVVPLRQGHIPILLAAGGLDGIVEDDTGRYLVKGSVRREAVTRIDRDNDGETEREKTSVTYRWLTRIMAWDLTPGQDFRLLTIE
ncbi:MAG: hypothetical protein L0H29_00360, partial [Sinobacteraceae bacterium]|nr:hypothetical protein [Nevskiaceae bacterium]